MTKQPRQVLLGRVRSKASSSVVPTFLYLWLWHTLRLWHKYWGYGVRCPFERSPVTRTSEEWGEVVPKLPLELTASAKMRITCWDLTSLNLRLLNGKSPVWGKQDRLRSSSWSLSMEVEVVTTVHLRLRKWPFVMQVSQWSVATAEAGYSCELCAFLSIVALQFMEQAGLWNDVWECGWSLSQVTNLDIIPRARSHYITYHY